MAEEVVVATGAASPEPLDHKRKLADLDNEPTEAAEENHSEPIEGSADPDAADVPISDESEAKRPRLDGKPDGNASENGHEEKKEEELEAKEDYKQSSEEEQPASVEVLPEKEETEQPTEESHEAGDAQDSAAEISQEDKTQELSKEESQPPEVEAAPPLQEEDVSNAEQDQPSSESETTTYKMEVPNSKVGVLIGKAGDTIRYLQYNSGAKIQIMRDAEADPNRLTRPVEIIGTSENIKKAEELINAVIAEADAGGSPSLIARGLTSSHSIATAEQIQLQVPNEKVGLIIGRGGETIKSLQTRSGARIQLIPQNLPEGDESKERTIRVTGDKKQIEIATDMIKEVMNQTVRPSPHSTGFNQQAYRPRGPGGPTQWGHRGPHPSHPAAYDYPHRGPYPSHNTQYQHPGYGNYPQQMGGPRSSYGSGWEQRPPPSMQGPPPSSGGYDYYGQRSHYSDAPPSHFPGAMPSHAPGPSPAPTHGPPQTQSSYNYSQQQGQGYGHTAPYSQAAPHQSYGHGYEQKYDHHAPAQNPYGGKNYPTRSKLEQLNLTPACHPEYQYKTEFQSHEPEFDYLKSLEIEEKINKIKWCVSPNGSRFILSTNDKTIKLWKVKEHKVKTVKEMNPNRFVSSENALLAEISFTSEQDKKSLSNGCHGNLSENMEMSKVASKDIHDMIADQDNTSRRRCRKVYAHAHDYNINSISNNSDGETFISADDLRINLWNFEISDQCFNIIDMKPSNMEDLTEIITSAEFHPLHCNLLAYSSSRGFIRLVDMRQSALCDHSAILLRIEELNRPKSFFTEIISSISDINFSSDGRFIISRDYMNLKLWDIHKCSSPVAVFKIHEHLRPRLCELYDNDSIFDRFECCLSADGLHFATGSYSNHLRMFSYGSGSSEGITTEVGKIPDRRPHLQITRQATTRRARRSSLSNLTRDFFRQGSEHSSSDGSETSVDLNSKLLHLAWHPLENLIACAAGSGLYIYYA